MREIWRRIENLDKEYYISNWGRVKNSSGYILKPYKNKFGYMQLNIHCGEKNKTFKISRLVAIHFLINPENKPQVNHIDGNKLNNKVDNLEWCTARENILHAHRTGLAGGVKHNTSKLSKSDILYIRTNYKPFDKNFGLKPLSEKFGVNRSTMNNVIYNKTYRLEPHSNIKPKSKYLTKGQRLEIERIYRKNDKNFNTTTLSKIYAVSQATISKYISHMSYRINPDECKIIRERYIPRHKEFGSKAMAQKYNVCERTMWKLLKNKIDYVI